ncbi:AFR269Wp [Eremothecium gossypii ATCC 10895]|uniref:AFR269Wp n=1 Tax=Eremothecium gossypii (strain ATCC 10895 / CBS 109.51 / FGSC 9923 / NRRL Y-1056) TaxID=284811 RepID=Q753P3_EREGS|nr:AFR269Wp [Eremothecium gossypii ATCC 10895]AAS53640.3 AFR269Wp [Eremothecium gossypii ATCC 10895]AEY97953.1 FAFR269Wp [Eremothecium gossypii FDAG1]
MKPAALSIKARYWKQSEKMDLRQLVLAAQSAGKIERESAEQSLLEACRADPAAVCVGLVKMATQENTELASRQFCLYTLRKLITMYWNAGFESYCGPPGVREDAKETVRDALLRMAVSRTQDSKIISASAYCVVQIAAVDFPDEWPGLLKSVYESITGERSLAALGLLHEIFDDVVSEEMFFQGGVGWQTIRIIFELLGDDGPVALKDAAMKLYHSCLLQLAAPQALEEADTRAAVGAHVHEALELFAQLLEHCRSLEPHADLLQFQAHTYENLVLIKTQLPKRFFPGALREALLDAVLRDLVLLGAYYEQHLAEGDEELLKAVAESAIHMVIFLSSVHECKLNTERMCMLLGSLARLSCLSAIQTEAWDVDYNSFISKETGLTSSYTPRDEIFQYLSDLGGHNYREFLRVLFEQLLQVESMAWRSQESLLFLLQSCQLNSEGPQFDEQTVAGLLEKSQRLLRSGDVHPLVRCRVAMTVPRLLEKYMDSLPNVKDLVREFVFLTFNTTVTSENQLLSASALIAFTYYSSFVDFGSVLGVQTAEELEKLVLSTIKNILDGIDEDTPGFLLEVLSGVTGCNKESRNRELKLSELQLVLNVATADPSNIQVVVEAQECLKNLLQYDPENYLQYAELCIPSFLEVLRADSSHGYAYTPLVSLSLELLVVFMRKKPVDSALPRSMVDYIFDPLSSMLLNAEDDELLQLSTEAFTALLASSLTDDLLGRIPVIITILEKLLSARTSHSAAINAGTLLIAVLTKFANQIQDIMPKILEAAAKRLVQIKNLHTAENLLFVFCYLTSIDARQTVDFLSSTIIDEGGRTALQAIVPRWLEAFEVLRGEHKIKENILSLSKLFFLEDPRIAGITVNGDLIPHDGDIIITRSMAKKMPDKYTQISAAEKIVKLFVAELAFQQNQPDPGRYPKDGSGPADPHDSEGDSADEDWEDVDDILDYEKLQEYADDSDIDDTGDSLLFTSNIEEDVTTLLTQFFKEAVARNASGFQEIYSRLTEQEKKSLSACMV